MRVSPCRFGRVLALALAAAAPAHAQVPGLGNIIPNPGTRETLPDIPPAPPQQPGFTLPRVPPPPPGGRLSTGPRFVLRGVRLVGNTVVPDADLQAIVAPYLGREIGTSDLQEIRQRVTLTYVERGYLNSGALLPDQTVTDGMVTLEIVEGRVAEVDVQGTDWLDPDYVRRRLERGAGPPLNVNTLQERLQVMLQDPIIDKLNVEIVPGIKPGEAILRTRVVENDPFSLYATVANTQSPNVGGERFELEGIARSLTGFGDTLRLRFGATEGLFDGQAYWAVPITSADTLLTFRAEFNDADVVAESFQSLDIHSRSRTYEIGLSQPVYRTPEQTVTVGATFGHRMSETFLLGQPFAFTPGTDNGRAEFTVLRVFQEYLDRSATEVIALRSNFSIGLDLLNATDVGMSPRPDFFAWLGQAQYIRRIFDEGELLLRADLQLSNDPLYTIEQFAVGGQGSVRGYRENQLVRDNGIVGSIEGRYPIGRVPLPYVSQGSEDGVIRIAPFFDIGSSWNTGRPTPSPETLASVGLGLRWAVSSRVEAVLYYGYALNDIMNVDRDIQDDGIHFRLTSRLY